MYFSRIPATGAWPCGLFPVQKNNIKQTNNAKQMCFILKCGL